MRIPSGARDFCNRIVGSIQRRLERERSEHLTDITWAKMATDDVEVDDDNNVVDLDGNVDVDVEDVDVDVRFCR